MKKNKSTKAKNKKLVRLLFILFLILIVTVIYFKKKEDANSKILEATARDAFVAQSILLADNLKNEYTDIESLEEDDAISFVSDAAIKTGKSEYYIRVNYGANCVNIYTKDDEKNYTVPYKAMICSTGISTPKSGTYQITYKYRWLRLFGNVYGQYSTRIVKNILFHSVPYFKQRADTLEYEEYDKLGTKASAGCIRLTVEDSKWIYDNIPSGTYVEFYSDPNNPGPLGKPKAQKISDNEECRNWDPTDPDKNNPWNGGNGIPSVTYTSTEKSNSSNKKPNNNSTNTNTNTNTTNSTKDNTITSNKNNTITTNSTVNSNKIDNNKVNENKKPNQSNTVKNEISTNTTNTNTNTSTQKPETNTTTKPNTNTTTDTSNKVENNTKPVEKPNSNTTKPDTNTQSKPDNNTTQAKPQEPEKPTTPDISTQTPNDSTNTSI